MQFGRILGSFSVSQFIKGNLCNVQGKQLCHYDSLISEKGFTLNGKQLLPLGSVPFHVEKAHHENMPI